MLFWKDIWVGDSPLTVQIPNPFVCARDWLAKASDYMVLEGDQVLWGPIFIKDLLEAEHKDFFTLLRVLST